MSDPRQLHVIGKKSEVADRTLNERKFCKPCDYYYSEMFTCPICYGADRERERIIKNIKSRVDDLRSCYKNDNCQEFATLIESYIEEWTESVS